VGVRDQDALAYAALQGGLKSTHKYVRATCPFCPYLVGKEDRRMSLAFNMKTQWYRCWRCSTKGRVEKVPDYLLRLEVVEQVSVETFDPPEEFVQFDGEENPLLYGVPLAYLRSRGISDRIVHEAKIGACLRGFLAYRVVIPILARNGHTWLGYSARDWTNRSPLRYRYPKGMQRGKILFNSAALDADSQEPIIAVEGVFDALPYWPHAVAFLGKPSHEQVDLLYETARPIVVVLDGDAHREAWALATKLKLAGLRAAMVRLPPKSDPNDVDRRWLVNQAREAIK